MEEFYNSESHILWVIYGRFDGGKHVLPYPLQNDWVFASPFTRGERPYWPDSVLKNHVRRAAIAAGITKTIGWHTFRHSVGSHLGQSGENVKVVEELLRHASSRIT